MFTEAVSTRFARISTFSKTVKAFTPSADSARRIFARTAYRGTWRSCGWVMQTRPDGQIAEQLKEDVEWRKEVAEKTGLGFALPDVRLGNLGNRTRESETAKAA